MAMMVCKFSCDLKFIIHFIHIVHKASNTNGFRV